MSVCEAPDCGRELDSGNPRARYCGVTCRSRTARARKAAQTAAAPPTEKPAAAGESEGPNEHELVTSVRRELTEAGVLDTVDGQIALQIARRVVDVGASGVASLSKELRAVLAEAKAAGPRSSTGGTDAVSDEDSEGEDEVARARRLREEARQAAGLT